MVDKKREMLQVMLAHQLHFAKTQVLVSWIPWIEESFACQDAIERLRGFTRRLGSVADRLAASAAHMESLRLPAVSCVAPLQLVSGLGRAPPFCLKKLSASADCTIASRDVELLARHYSKSLCGLDALSSLRFERAALHATGRDGSLVKLVLYPSVDGAQWVLEDVQASDGDLSAALRLSLAPKVQEWQAGGAPVNMHTLLGIVGKARFSLWLEALYRKVWSLSCVQSAWLLAKDGCSFRMTCAEPLWAAPREFRVDFCVHGREVAVSVVAGGGGETHLLSERATLDDVHHQIAMTLLDTISSHIRRVQAAALWEAVGSLCDPPGVFFAQPYRAELEGGGQVRVHFLQKTLLLLPQAFGTAVCIACDGRAAPGTPPTLQTLIAAATTHGDAFPAELEGAVRRFFRSTIAVALASTLAPLFALTAGNIGPQGARGDGEICLSFEEYIGSFLVFQAAAGGGTRVVLQTFQRSAVAGGPAPRSQLIAELDRDQFSTLLCERAGGAARRHLEGCVPVLLCMGAEEHGIRVRINRDGSLVLLNGPVLFPVVGAWLEREADQEEEQGDGPTCRYRIRLEVDARHVPRELDWKGARLEGDTISIECGPAPWSGPLEGAWRLCAHLNRSYRRGVAARLGLAAAAAEDT